MKGVRVDQLLVEKGLAPSREKARAMVLAGLVVVNAHRVSKPGQAVAQNADVRCKEQRNRYVSRGGFKLEAALNTFRIDVSGSTCVDVGASTGGFTDCLLQRGARRVYAVDVGYGQLAWKLRDDPRVVSLERQNVRNLDPAAVSQPVDLVVVDTSFISLRLVLPKVWALLGEGGDAVALVKPQFEVGRGRVGKGGTVRDAELRLQAVKSVQTVARELGFEVVGTIESPVTGAKKGNVEYLVHLTRGTRAGKEE